MSLLQLKASLALWKRRLKVRQQLLAEAKQDLLEARTNDVHPRQQIVDKVNARTAQLKEAADNINRREAQIAVKEAGKVRRPYERIRRSVSNQSSRNGVSPKLIVLHSTESHNRPGTSDVEAIVAWFDNPASQASSHVVVDAEGIAAQCVPDSKKAWTQAAYNPQSLAVEQIGHASQTTWPEAQLRKTAQYIAYWSKKYNIPISFSTSRGVCEHRHLGAAGGGHHDCGEPYPLDRVLDLAREYRKNGW